MYEHFYRKKRLLDKEDPNDDLWVRNADRCCELRKVMPLENKLIGMKAWISGRKSIHKGQREKLKVFEALNHKIVVNPLVNITRRQVDNYFKQNALPEHPASERLSQLVVFIVLLNRVTLKTKVRSLEE